MIIDCILDRKDDENFYGCDKYNAKEFYLHILAYGTIGREITRAMDYGTEEDVKSALCRYILDNEYNPEICSYIVSKNWITDACRVARG